FIPRFNAGSSINLFSPSAAATNDSTSRRSSLSSPHSLLKNTARSAPASCAVAWNNSSTRCQLKFTLDLPSQPCLRHVPIPHHGNRRYFQDFGCLVHAQSTKVSVLDYPGFSFINQSQLVECFVEC